MHAPLAADTAPPDTASTPSPPATAPSQIRRRRVLLLGALVVLAGVALWLVLRGGDDDAAAPASVLSTDELRERAAGVGHPVFWLGARKGGAYELTRTSDGRVYIRYVPAGADAGSSDAEFLSVGTYPQPRAFATLKATAERQRQPIARIPGGGIAFADGRRPTSAYAAYPGLDLQVEVYDPTAGRALELLAGGGLEPVVRPASTAVTVAELRALDDRLGHPVYWAGERPAAGYELTRTTDGRVYVRYLPPGRRAGDPDARLLTVGTYPQEDPVATLRSAADAAGGTVVELPGGGVGYVDVARPTSAYVAFPGTDVQVEVYSGSAERTRRLLTAGRIQPVG